MSRGRSIRQIIGTLSIVAPLVTMFWFTVVGARASNRAESGSVTAHGNEPEAMLLGITQNLPWAGLVSALFIFLSFISVATNGDAMPIPWPWPCPATTRQEMAARFWCVGMTGAVVLITIGAGGVSALQSFIVITAVPVSLLILPALWDAPRIAPWRASNRPARGVGEAV